MTIKPVFIVPDELEPAVRSAYQRARAEGSELAVAAANAGDWFERVMAVELGNMALGAAQSYPSPVKAVRSDAIDKLKAVTDPAKMDAIAAAIDAELAK